MARPSIKAAVAGKVKDEGKGKVVPKAKAKQPASREGKVNISGYFPPEVKSSLRLVQAKRPGKIAALLGEALNLLFAKYGVPEAAPED